MPDGWHVSARDISNWAENNPLEAQEKLPLLIQKLIFASVGVAHLHLPAGDSILNKGWDGIVDALEGTAYVPAGQSVWELSTQENAKDKASKDYEKRTNDSLGIDKKTATFVIVTCREWGNSEQWLSEKQKDGYWMAIRVIKNSDIETWLSICPSVHYWFAVLIGKVPEGAWDTEEAWRSWIQSTKPCSNEKLVLAGREKEEEDLLKLLQAQPAIIRLSSDWVEEAYAFALATVRKRAKLSSRLLVVKDPSDWDLLVRNSLPLILMPQFEETTNLGYAVSRGHYVIMPVSSSQRVVNSQIVLPAMENSLRIDALVSMGVHIFRAKEIVITSRGYLSVIRRHPYIAIDKKIPQWGRPENAKIALTALFAGKWVESNEEDRKFLETVSSIPYNEFEQRLHFWVISGDPLCELFDNEWKIVSYVDSWSVLSSFVSSGALEKFFKDSKEILIEQNPSFEIPPDERWMANVMGKVTSHSNSLREGIAVMFALLGSHGDKDCENIGQLTIQQQVSAVVSEILTNNMTEKSWYSLHQELLFLAEAAPERFMDAVENSLKSEKPSIMTLFIEGSMGHYYHTGLLYGLEALSWNKEYLPRVVRILAKLNQFDPGGRLIQRPLNTLIQIFSCKRPQTNATLDERLALVESLILFNPETGWKLLVRLIPDKAHKGLVDNICRPKFHQWSKGWKQISEQEIEEYSLAIQNIFIKKAINGPPNRWIDVLDQLSNLHIPYLERAIAELSNTWQCFPQSAISDIREKLRTTIAQHQEFADAFGALPHNYVNDLKEIFLSMLPDDLIEKNRFLFDRFDPDLTDISGRLKYKEKMVTLQNKRLDAIQAIWSNQGIEGIELLISKAKEPRIIGGILGISNIAENVKDDLLGWLGSDNRALAQAAMTFTFSMYEKNSDWLSVVYSRYKDWPNEAWVNLCLSLPISSELINILEKLDQEVQTNYWSNLNNFNLPKNDSKAVNTILERLLANNRPFAVIIAGNSYLSEVSLKAGLNYDFLISALEWVVSKPSDISTYGQMVGYELSELLKDYESSEKIDEARLVKLEWTYLRVFSDWKIKPMAILKNIKANPRLLVEIACLSSRPTAPVEGEAKIPDGMLAHYRISTFELLKLIDELPGQKDGGYIDPNILKDWVAFARAEFKEKNRISFGEELIGRVLFHAPIGEDNIWPHKAVREIIETSESVELEIGVECQHIDQRGVTASVLGEGGKAEREIADKLIIDADKLNFCSPRTALLLRKIAKSYLAYASISDIQDKKVRSRL